MSFMSIKLDKNVLIICQCNAPLCRTCRGHLCLFLQLILFDARCCWSLFFLLYLWKQHLVWQRKCSRLEITSQTISGGPCDSVLTDFKKTCRKCQDYTTMVKASVDDTLEQMHELTLETDIPVEEIRGSFAYYSGSKSRKEFDISVKSSNGQLSVFLQIYFKYIVF